MGAIVRIRRNSLGLRQIDVVRAANETLGVTVISEPTYRALEKGRTNATDRTLAGASVGLRWPSDALARIRQGEEPDSIDPRSVQVDASGVDLEELRHADPESYEQIIGMARIALDRARRSDHD